jgi:hypothetical protein
VWAASARSDASCVLGETAVACVEGRGNGGLARCRRLPGRGSPRLDRTRALEPRSRATRLDRRGRRGRVRIAGLLCGAGPPAAEARHGHGPVPGSLLTNRDRYRDAQLHPGRAGHLDDLLVRATTALLGAAVGCGVRASALDPGRYRDARAAGGLWSRPRQSRLCLSSTVAGARRRGRHPRRSHPRSPPVRPGRALGYSTAGRI